MFIVYRSKIFRYLFCTNRVLSWSNMHLKPRWYIFLLFIN